METLLSDESRDDEHYHDTKEHGLIWVLLNEMLHLIVLLFTLFGMIRFKVRFIHMVKLVNLISSLMIIHSWYMTIKFGSMATIMYFFNHELEQANGLPWSAFNCSLENADRVLALYHNRSESKISSISDMGQQEQQASGGNGGDGGHRSSYTLLLAQMLQIVGGPYKMLGNMTTLMYGFYAMAILIMLAIFPIELMYLNVGFNYIRFVLNDPGCLKDFYEKRKKHLGRLKNWSRNRNRSFLTLSMKKITNQHDLRSNYLLDCRKIGGAAAFPASPVTDDDDDDDDDDGDGDANAGDDCDGKKSEEQDAVANSRYANLTKRSGGAKSTSDVDGVFKSSGGRAIRQPPSPIDVIVARKFRAPLKSLRHSLSTNHLDQPSYSVRIANKNLRKFRPLVRSENWFKLSMVLYPIFILFYFVTLTIFLGLISKYFSDTLEATNEACQGEVDPTLDLYSNWSLLDRMTFFETHYVVFTLSCASSFYCSYYFCTMLELHVWLQEISQQLNLCKLILELTNNQYPVTSMQTIRVPSPNYKSPILSTNYTSRIIKNPDASPLIEAMTAYHNIDSEYVDKCFNQFGGLKCLLGYMNFAMAQQSERLKRREYMACKLVFKKQTVLRATYINLNLFFDELNDTRFMIKTILKRTTQIVFGFALLVGITRSQFKWNYIYLTFLLAACLAILNFYLICAASINSTVNKLLPQIHGFISASIGAGADQDLLEFWLRHIQAYGTDKDAMSYKIYGYKITWSSILNFNGAVSSAYLFTVY